MSRRNTDAHNRWRSKTIAFRVSPEENDQINKMVKLTGMTKQDYITSNMLKHSFTVFPNPRVQKTLRIYLQEVVNEMKKISDTSEISSEFLDVLMFALQIIDKMN